MEPIIFTQKQLDIFSRASADINPLHIDSSYAARTPFGSIVVFGIAAAIRTLATWVGDNPVALKNISIQFKRPVFLDTEYTVCRSEKNGKITLELQRQSQTQLKLRFELQSAISSNEDWTLTESFSPLAAPQPTTHQPQEFSTFPYSVAPERFYKFLTAFSLRRDQLPASQLATLLWSSYFVGMVAPGEQALFATLKVDFSDTVSTTPQLTFRDVAATFDQRFNKYTVNCAADGVASLALEAFARPTPIEFSTSELKSALTDAPDFSGDRVLVTGAARGFGAALVGAFALKGATALANTRSTASAQAPLFAELQSDNYQLEPVTCDLSDERQCIAMAGHIAEAGSPLDILVLNATPAIRNYFFLEQTNEELLDFVGTSLKIFSNPLRHLLPALNPGATVVAISTTYVNESPAQFSHYVSAKAAQESLLRGVASEFPKINFHVVRLPQMLTDQTNLPFHPSPPACPMALASRVLEKIKAPIEGRNFEVAEL